jgi:hypothetical protein
MTELWDVSRRNRNKLLVTKMGYVRRRCKRTGLGRLRNEAIREMMEMAKNITDKVNQ